MISQAAVDLIVASEVSSRALYERKYTHPEWPGEQSGVTIGIGYDVGYASVAKLQADWKALIPDDMIATLTPCCGVHGVAAHELTIRIGDKVMVPWAPAMEVFMHRDVPKWTADVCREIPGADQLPADCLGALVSLAYNRGSFLTQDKPTDSQQRRKEMRAIRNLIMAGQLDAVADQFRSMKRLWPNSRGLRERRDAEAKLWERGLSARGQAPLPPPVKNETPPPLVPPVKVGKSEGGTAGGGVVITGTGAASAANAGASPKTIMLIVLAGLIATVVLAAATYLYRNRPILARAKG